jgi:hypothetical protein
LHQWDGCGNICRLAGAGQGTRPENWGYDPDCSGQLTALEYSSDLLPATISPQIDDISRGYDVTVPGIGNILIFHRGDVVFNGLKIRKPVHIVDPSNVARQDTDVDRMIIESSSVLVINQKKATMGSLNFQSNDGDVADIYADPGNDLTIGTRSRKNTRLAKIRKITLNGPKVLDNISILNGGEMETVQSLHNVSHLWNFAEGIVRSMRNLMISTIAISNMGIMIALSINITAEYLLSNFLIIQSGKE